jgi:hypothetical protein
MEKCGGTTASIMAQNRIGGCWLTDYGFLRFHLGEQFIIDHDLKNNKTHVKNLQTGHRTGTR